MSDTNRVQVYGLKEVTYGVTPASPLVEARFTGESLKQNITTIQSKEIRSDRQVTDLIRTNFEPQGGINGELSYGTYDDYMESALASAWGTALTLTGTTISAAAADNSFNFSATNCPAFVVGQWVKVSGFVTSANNGFFRVVSRTTAKLVVAGGTALLINEAAAPSVTVKSTRLQNGTTSVSLTIEKLFSDKTLYHAFTGMIVSQWDLNFSSGAILDTSFSFMGKALAASGATVGTGAPTAASTTEVMSSVANVARLLEGGSDLPAGVYARELKITANNNTRQRPALGVLGSTGTGLGEFNVTGSMMVYFENHTMFTKYLNGTATSVTAIVTDAAGNSYVVTLPRIKFSDFTIVAGGSNADVMADIKFQAMRDPTSGITMAVDRFA